MQIDSYNFLEPLGRGSFGESWVIEALGGESNKARRLAAKISYLDASSDKTAREMQNTIPILSLNHPNILQLLAINDFMECQLILIMELADHCLLSKWKRYQSEGFAFPVNELLKYMHQSARAIDSIHKAGFIHGGVNPTDILLIGNEAKIADPGPICIDDKTPILWPQCGNYCKWLCMAPESINGNPNPRSDQYALAATYAWVRNGSPIVRYDGHHVVIDSQCLTAKEVNVLLKATSYDYDCRFQSCEELMSEFDAATNAT
jgi:serine/threonine protein kinase